MSRRRSIKKRQVLPDPKYGDRLITKFINSLMMDGKRGVAEKIMYSALERVAEKGNGDALEVFHKAIENVRPEYEVRSRRIGGATYQVPTPVNANRSIALSMRWLVSASRKGKETTMFARLSSELIAASNGAGPAVKKREDTHKMADANKAFAHYKW